MSSTVTGEESDTASAPAPAGQRPPTVPRWRRSLRPYLLSIPALALTIGILYPFIVGVQYSFQNYSSANERNVDWIGFANYQQIFDTDSAFFIGPAAWVTVQYAILATVVETVLGVGVALLLNRSTIIGRIFEKVLILPLMIAPAIAALAWKFMFNADFGVLNYMFGIRGFDWLSSDRALFSAVLVDVWIYTPFVAILVLAGIRSLPKEPFEASAVDDASGFYAFRRLTLPLIWPYILVAVIFRLMDCLKMFDIPYILTGGGPGTATTTLQIQAYNDTMNSGAYSRAATGMFILWAIVFVTARLLVGALGKAQRRAAGAED